MAEYWFNKRHHAYRSDQFVNNYLKNNLKSAFFGSNVEPKLSKQENENYVFENKLYACTIRFTVITKLY